MSLDNNAIETLSINAVRSSIVMCDFLSQFIADNDKEPSWDGFVNIYHDKKKSKDKLKGRMPVQVKGVECDDLSKESISYSMNIVDLQNYLADGGCILFVVYIGNNGAESKIYYSELTPIKLRQLLKEAGTQKSKTVHLKSFPHDNNRKATIFLNCLQNCQKQASFKDGRTLSIEELEEQGLLESIVIPFSGVGVDDPQSALIDNEVYLYAKVKGSSIIQPLEIIPEDVHTQQRVNANITIDNKLFYTEYKVIRGSGETSFKIGESLIVRFTNNGYTCEIKYRNSNKMRILAHDLEFMLSYIDKGYFKINDSIIPLDFCKEDLAKFDISNARIHLEQARKVVEVLDILGCTDDIDLNDMSAEDWRNLNRLVIAFVNKKPVNDLKDNLPPVCCMRIGKLRFVLYFKQLTVKNSVEYEISDFFKTELSVFYNGVYGEKLPISQFFILNKNDFLTLSNIDFDALLPSFKKTEHHYDKFNRANWFLLDLISAYDEAKGNRKEELLRVCNDFSEWMLTTSDDELDYQVKTLNRFQVIKRMRDFTEEEISALYEFVEGKNTREDSLIGAYLLLGQQQAADIHLKKLSIEEQDIFKKYPIFHFYK